MVEFEKENRFKGKPGKVQLPRAMDMVHSIVLHGETLTFNLGVVCDDVIKYL